MNKNIIIGIVIVLVIITVAVVYNKKTVVAPASTETTTTDQTQNTLPPGNDSVDMSATTTITYTDSGFSPSTVTIDQGDAVVFENKSSKSFWPASGEHPTHLLYPEFDAKKAIAVGSSYSFTFEKVGSWPFHNHMKSGDMGTITVK